MAACLMLPQAWPRSLLDSPPALPADVLHPQSLLHILRAHKTPPQSHASKISHCWAAAKLLPYCWLFELLPKIITRQTITGIIRGEIPGLLGTENLL